MQFVGSSADIMSDLFWSLLCCFQTILSSWCEYDLAHIIIYSAKSPSLESVYSPVWRQLGASGATQESNLLSSVLCCHLANYVNVLSALLAHNLRPRDGLIFRDLHHVRGHFSAQCLPVCVNDVSMTSKCNQEYVESWWLLQWQTRLSHASTSTNTVSVSVTVSCLF